MVIPQILTAAHCPSMGGMYFLALWFWVCHMTYLDQWDNNPLQNNQSAEIFQNVCLQEPWKNMCDPILNLRLV